MTKYQHTLVGYGYGLEEILEDDVKSNFSPVYTMYSKNPIPLEEIESAHAIYINETKPVIELRKKRGEILLPNKSASNFEPNGRQL